MELMVSEHRIEAIKRRRVMAIDRPSPDDMRGIVMHDVPDLLEDLATLKATLAAREARVRELEAVLAPFAKLRAELAFDLMDDMTGAWLLRAGDIRRAAAALAGAGRDGAGEGR